MNSENEILIAEFRRFLETKKDQPPMRSSASAVTSSLRADSSLAQNVGRVFSSALSTQATAPTVSAIAQGNRPQLPSIRQPAHRYSGRYVPYGRKKKSDERSYDMKLILVDFIPQVMATGRTEKFNGTTLLESPFRVQERELNTSIRRKIFEIIRSR